MTMGRAALAACGLLLLTCVLAASSTHVRLATTAHARGLPYGWAKSRAADADRAVISFELHLVRQNVAELDATFHAVNSPSSARWGDFLTLRQVRELVAASPAAIGSVRSWLADAGVPASSIAIGTDSIKVSALPVRIASALFSCAFARFEHGPSGESRIRADGDVLLPAAVAAHVELITGLTEFFSSRINGFRYGSLRTSAALGGSGPVVVPSVLRKWYNTQNANCTNSSNILGIAAFDDNFSFGALRAFERNQSEPFVHIRRVWSPYVPADEFESDLDVQYGSSMATGAAMQFVGTATGWVLDFVNEAVTLQPSPSIYSISYGWSELAQCELTSDCATLGYSSEQYVNRTNQGFQMMGAAGITVFVSSGDDGSPSLGAASGNCPLDVSTFCPLGGCLNASQAAPKCASITVLTDGNNTRCDIPMGLGSDACSGFLNSPNASDVLLQWVSDNAACNAAVLADVEGDPWPYATCECAQLVNSTLGGYTVTQYVYEPAVPAFAPDYPTSSPYVVSVGATQFIVNADGSLSEGVCSIETGAIITTGAGFSAFQPQMPWQTAAVQKYVSTAQGLPPSSTFDATKRAYPDIVANGHNYWIAYSPINKDRCGKKGCQFGAVDGTSCSSPASAGFFTLINDALMNAGLPPLGAVAEALYKAAEEEPSVFNSIANSATTRCNRFACCEWGFPAMPGDNAGVWSAATGLGSPNVHNLLTYFVKAKTEHKLKYGKQ